LLCAANFWKREKIPRIVMQLLVYKSTKFDVTTRYRVKPKSTCCVTTRQARRVVSCVMRTTVCCTKIHGVDSVSWRDATSGIWAIWYRTASRPIVG